MNIIAKEYHSSVKKNLQNRNKLRANKNFQGSHPCGFLNLWVYAIVCFVINLNSMITNAFNSNKEDLLHPRKSSIQRFCKMNKDVSSGQNS